jgi:hypothetical protein
VIFNKITKKLTRKSRYKTNMYIVKYSLAFRDLISMGEKHGE